MAGFLKNIRIALKFFVDLVFPVTCLGCNHEGLWLCKTCFDKIDYKASQYCLHCKKPNLSGFFCDTCQDNYYLSRILIATDYDQVIIAKLIKTMKYNFIEDLALDLAKIIIKFIKKNNIDLSEHILIPAPLSRRRYNWRGFNQAQLIALEIAKEFTLEIDFNNLIKRKHSQPQAELDEKERQENLKQAFWWCGNSLSGKKIILIDDVVTTGATLNECAKVLKEAGASEIWGLVVAKG